MDTKWDIPWKFNVAPENGWLEDEFPFGIPYFQGRTVKLREGMKFWRFFWTWDNLVLFINKKTRTPISGHPAMGQRPTRTRQIPRFFEAKNIEELLS